MLRSLVFTSLLNACARAISLGVHGISRGWRATITSTSGTYVGSLPVLQKHTANWAPYIVDGSLSCGGATTFNRAPALSNCTTWNDGLTAEPDNPSREIYFMPDGTKYTKGIYWHGNPEQTWVSYDITGMGFTSLTACVGISMDGSAADGGYSQYPDNRFTFAVENGGDGCSVTHTRGNSGPCSPMVCDITGLDTLKLTLDCLDKHGYSGAVWGEAQLFGTSPTGSPTNVPVSPSVPTSPSPGSPAASTPGTSASTVGVSAKGDPHLQNVHGQRFDLMMAGFHVLLHIPRGAPQSATLLHVSANAQRLGARCADIYFQHINISGKWVGPAPDNALEYHVRDTCNSAPQRVQAGVIELKVVHGCTSGGIRYLNLVARNVGASKIPVGGLLGEDDHSVEATPSPQCLHVATLWRKNEAATRTAA